MADITLSAELLSKLDALEAHYKELGNLAVGFSGGVDSTFMLYTAFKTLGDRAVAITATDPAFPERELKDSKSFCEAHGIRQILVPVDPLRIESFRKNEKDRCYHCKKAIFKRFKEIAMLNGFDHVAEGSNVSDLSDYRPGLKAVDELGIKSPLRHAALTKDEIRLLSKEMGLPTHDKPSYACLATRLATGEEITVEKLKRIEAAEDLLISLGFTEERVRTHGDMARIEVRPDDIARIASPEIRMVIEPAFRELGFTFVTLDLSGYRTGSMNI